MYFTGDNGHQIFSSFAPILSSLILDSEITNWLLTKILPKKTFDNGRVILKFNNCFSVKIFFFIV